MTVRVLRGHVLDVLAGLPEKSVHVCVTSPPYWGLRAYGTPPQIWGGAEGCAHEWGEPITDKKRGQDAGASARVGNTKARVCPPETQQGAFCGRCGAWRGELGSEPTLDLFVAHLVEVFAAVRRVLRDDGTLWVNLGDSYAADGRKGRAHMGEGKNAGYSAWANKELDGLDQGNLCMAPARFALAMQQAGWTLRSEMTLCKTAPMPESVQGARWERCRVKTVYRQDVRDGTIAGRAGDGAAIHFDHRTPRGSEWADCPGCPKCAATDGYVQRWGSGRPTSATEKLYLFAKAGQRYFYDLDATRQPASEGTLERWKGPPPRIASHDPTLSAGAQSVKGEFSLGINPAGRNLWNYVMWAPEPLKAAHYAAYPRWLPRLAIKAGTSERGCCPVCAAPWLRVVERRFTQSSAGLKAGAKGMPAENDWGGYPRGTTDTTTLGWRQSCACPAHEPAPCTVLDCFGGSGTTGIEANALGRHAVLCELQERYVAIAHKRLSREPVSLFAWEQEEGAAG